MFPFIFDVSDACRYSASLYYTIEREKKQEIAEEKLHDHRERTMMEAGTARYTTERGKMQEIAEEKLHDHRERTIMEAGTARYHRKRKNARNCGRKVAECASASCGT